MRFTSSLVLLLFGLVWCGALAFMDASMFARLARQIRARDFPSTAGQVTQSEVIATPRSKGRKSYREAIRYAYVVGGREFTSDYTALGGIRFGNGRRQAEALVAQYPAGKELAVFYDPAAPGEAVLRPGVLPEHLLLGLFLVPFHVIGFGLLYLALEPLVGRLVPAARALTLRPLDDLRMVVRMPWLAPWAVGMITFAAASFVALLVAPFLLPQPASMPGAIAVWIVVLAAAACAALRRRAQLTAGLADLAIDAGARTVTLPLGCGRKERVTLPFGDIHGVKLRQLPATVTRTTKRGWTVTKKSGSPPYELALIGPSEQPFPLVTSAMPERLRAIAEALERTFGWPLVPGTGAGA